jgi:hypothetical protein
MIITAGERWYIYRRSPLAVRNGSFFHQKCLGQSIVQSTGSRGRIFSAVIDENCVGHRPAQGLETSAYPSAR